MEQVNIAKAKARLSELVERAEHGEVIVIARDNKPAAKLVPVSEPKKRVKILGLYEGRGWISDDFNEPFDPFDVR
jgi:prevent-host-death family protein